MTANIGLALAIIVILFPLALFGVLGLAGVVLMHKAAEVVVIFNGIRAAHRPGQFDSSHRHLPRNQNRYLPNSATTRAGPAAHSLT